jgi:catechol 2,3-dioxygenase-like lactoylglutathione lyase family enzyme
MSMIIGTHVLFYSTNPEADRGFFRDVLGFRSVDAGEGWLIFKMPPAEAGFHPVEDEGGESPGERHALDAAVYLMCDDLGALIKSLEAKKVKCGEIAEEAWGIRTSITLPSGGEIGLYQPKHPTALELG